MSDGTVRYEREGALAKVIFDRPQARNAMTWSMYDQLHEICERIRLEPGIRVATFRGAGGDAFVAGTDIRQFTSFASGEDGVAYERRMEVILGAIDALPVPTLAIVQGWCVGGGLAIAASCDLRISNPAARFGVPIARTLGNCLAAGTCARLVAELGVARTKRLILLAEMLSATEAREAGFVSAIVEDNALDDHVAAMVGRLAQHAPVTMRVTKEAIRRVLRVLPVADEDLLLTCYGSTDFRHGVEAFLAKRPPSWTGN